MGLNTLDLGIIVVYLAGVTLFGLRFRGRQQTLKGYFLADNAIPWWAISLSIVAAETSTLTVISVPGTGVRQGTSLSATGHRLSDRPRRRELCVHPAVLSRRSWSLRIN